LVVASENIAPSQREKLAKKLNAFAEKRGWLFLAETGT
jgi:hypothetical protein